MMAKEELENIYLSGNNIGDKILANFIRDYSIWSHYIKLLIQVIRFYEEGSLQIVDLAIQIINQYS